jgi:ABC-2 type transport system permease protein
MRKILKIAKLEISILFYSPVAWLVLSVFMIQCGIGFLANMHYTRMGLSSGYHQGPITLRLFGGNFGLFTVIQSNIYLYLPILTMGLMSRETSSGSIKLLLSSPVRLREIILGKYLAIITYGLFLIAVLGIYVVIGMATISNADAGMLLSGLVGLYLLICTYAAIGLFMSCLTTYQVVAAISTLAVFAVLKFVDTIGQNIDFIRDLTFFLSISGRINKMVAGLITTNDLFYYLIIICLFLSLCVLRLKSERELKPWTIKIGRYILLICAALLLGYITSRPMMISYLDVTANKSLTITKSNQQIAQQIKGPLKVTTYSNMLSPNLWYTLPESRNTDLATLEQYERFIPGMKFSYVYYYEKPTDTINAEYRFNSNLKGVTNVEKIAETTATAMSLNKNMFMKPTAINKLIDLAPEGYLVVRKLEYNGRSSFLRFYVNEMSPFPDEPEVMAAIKRLVVKAPKVVFITGNNERGIDKKGDREYKLISNFKTRKQALANQGFDIDTINLNKQDFKDDADIVVLGDPTVPFTVQEQQKLLAYIDKGGNMLINGEPGRQEILNPILQHLSVQLKAGILIKPDNDLTPGFINANFSKKALGLDSNIDRLQKRGGTVAVQGAAAIDYQNQGKFSINPLLLSSEGGWNKSKPTDFTSVSASFNPQSGDQKGIFPIAVSITRNISHKQQRIIISGDADFMSNAELSRGQRGDNEYFMDGLFRWLSNGAFPIDASRPPAKDIQMNISDPQITLLMWVCKGIIPGIIAIIGSIVLITRRRN